MLTLLRATLSAHPETAWDERVDPACCPYPEHDPRDYNWYTCTSHGAHASHMHIAVAWPCRPYSHFQYSEVIPDVTGSFVPMTTLNVRLHAHGSSCAAA